MDKVTMKIGEYSSVNRLDDCERRLDCHARRILDLEDRVVFCGRLTVVALFLSAIAVVMSALF